MVLPPISGSFSNTPNPSTLQQNEINRQEQDAQIVDNSNASTTSELRQAETQVVAINETSASETVENRTQTSRNEAVSQEQELTQDVDSNIGTQIDISV